MAPDTRPLPSLDRAETEPFWEAARRKELILPRCQNCTRWIWYPQKICYQCGSDSIQWEPIGTGGTVYSFVVLRQALHPAFTNRLPLVVALVSLDDAPYVRLTANILDCPVDAVEVGMPLEVAFEDVNEDVTLPQFRPRHPVGADHS
jgi:uncharacterized OB-fold protein